MSDTFQEANALNARSRTLLEGPDRAGARSMLKAVGLTDEDLQKPLIGIANTWTEIGPCNFHLRRLAMEVRKGIIAAGGTPLEFNTVSISDGITMGTEGMKASLVSREVIADSIELVARANMLDGVIALSACDKTIPGTIMALIRLNVPSLMLYGGTIAPGRFKGILISSACMKPLAHTRQAKSAPRISKALKIMRVLGQGHAAANIPRTQWR
jgi:dihydroxy-acid dehydratase